MKAAVLQQLDSNPKFMDFEVPKAKQGQLLVKVLAASVKNLDRLKTKSSFYASFKILPAVTGSDGVGVLENGTRIYANGLTGMFAENAIIAKDNYVVLPEQLPSDIAAALPNAVMGSVAPLRLRTPNIKNSTILINGATGFTGQVAVQAAKYYGAGRVIVTGRDEERLEYLKSLGADDTLPLTPDYAEFEARLSSIIKDYPIDTVLDYTWGEPAERIIEILKNGRSHATRFINIGSNAGTKISLDANTVRGSAIEVLGMGLGSYTGNEISRINAEFVPKMYQLAAKGGLKLNIETAPLSDIKHVWESPTEAGTRMVLLMQQ